MSNIVLYIGEVFDIYAHDCPFTVVGLKVKSVARSQALDLVVTIGPSAQFFGGGERNKIPG
ncbi:hypothetical protein ACI48D_20115 [Massilia sp. LXY-6]|uniref:hypothetical protein n=1 Tax=Massilia sp. LXY-6 TaxID=3379823 RepID=UPI003EE009AE